jgi:hypothetical protein
VNADTGIHERTAAMASKSDLDFGSHRELAPVPHMDDTFVPAWCALEAERAKLAKQVPSLNQSVADRRRESEAATRKAVDAVERRRLAQVKFDKIREQQKALIGP